MHLRQNPQCRRNAQLLIESREAAIGRGSLFATGAGLFTQALPDGAIVHPPLSKPILPVSVLFDGQPAEVLYAGAAPDLVAGALQVNVRVPANAAGSYHRVQLQVGELISDAVRSPSRLNAP